MNIFGLIGWLKVAKAIAFTKKMVVCNARATSFTKANVTNMCDNWIGPLPFCSSRSCYPSLLFVTLVLPLYTKANVTSICDNWDGKGDISTKFNHTL